jgi:hypothetical protein
LETHERGLIVENAAGDDFSIGLNGERESLFDKKKLL